MFFVILIICPYALSSSLSCVDSFPQWIPCLPASLPPCLHPSIPARLQGVRRDGGNRGSRGERPCWERGNLPCAGEESRGAARGHFTLMAAGPIETTAALHDLKVRRQWIIFQWWCNKGVPFLLLLLLFLLLLLLLLFLRLIAGQHDGINTVSNLTAIILTHISNIPHCRALLCYAPNDKFCFLG